MCITGLNHLKTCGMGMSVGAALIGNFMTITGIILGSTQGWNALAISLIASGGTILIPGYFGCFTISEGLKDQKATAVKKSSEVYEKNIQGT